MRSWLARIVAVVWLAAIHVVAAESIALEAASAKVTGGARYEPTSQNIGYWNSVGCRATWSTNLTSPGTYRVHIVYACQDKAAGSTYDVILGNQKANGTVRATGTGWHTYIEEDLGPVLLRKPGPLTVDVVSKSKPGQAVMNLRKIILVREER